MNFSVKKDAYLKEKSYFCTQIINQAVLIMRIFTLTMALWCVGALSMNAQSFHVSQQTDALPQTLSSAVFTPPSELSAPIAAPKKAKKHPIDEQPEGTLREYEMATEYYSQNMDEWVHRYGQKTLVVFNGDEVYIQNIINTNTYGTWIVGEISADRKQVVFDNYQPYVEQGDNTYYVCLGYVNDNGDVLPDTEADEFTLDYDEATGTLMNHDLNISLVNEDGGVFTFNEGYHLQLHDAEVVKLPAGKTDADAQAYSLKWDSKDPYYFPLMAYVIQDGDDFYFKGFSTKNPEAWVKGTFNAEKDSVIIPNGQYVGLYDDLYYLYCKGATYSGLDEDGWPIYKNKDHAALKYNAEDKSFYGPDGILFVLGKQLIGGYSQSIPSQDLKPFYGVAAKPKMPTIRNFDIDLQYFTVQSSITYVVPVEDVNGNFINPDSLYYRFYLDGEQLHFVNGKGEYYQHFPDEWEVPSRFTDRGKVNNRTDNNNGTQTYHVMAIDKDLRPKTISLQSIYYMNGTRTLSDICVYNTTTKATTITEGDPDPSGIENAQAESLNVASETVYDLQGRRVNAARKGLFIRSQRMSDGSIKNVKVLR